MRMKTELAEYQELLKAAQEIWRMFEEGKIVRDISKDSQFAPFSEQSKEFIICLTNFHLAIARCKDINYDKADKGSET